MATNVLIAGAGPAALEAALTLHRIAGERIVTTVLAPHNDFNYRPLSVLEPFAAGGATDYPARTHRRGRRLPAPSGLPGHCRQHRPSCADVRPLPLYELALMLAERAFTMGIKPELHFVTLEAAPLAIFGPEAPSEVAELLSAAGVVVHASSRMDRLERGQPASRAGRQGPRRAAGRDAPAPCRARDPGCPPTRTASWSHPCVARHAADRALVPVPAPRRRNRPLDRRGRALWWPPVKIAGRELTGYLQSLDDDLGHVHGLPVTSRVDADTHAIEVLSLDS